MLRTRRTPAAAGLLLAAARGAPAGFAISLQRVEMSRVQIDDEALRVSLEVGFDIR